jgi:hypothetical protein
MQGATLGCAAGQRTGGNAFQPVQDRMKRMFEAVGGRIFAFEARKGYIQATLCHRLCFAG